jgi:protein SCO1/2
LLIRRPAAVLLALALPVAACRPREEPLPVLFELPQFTLVERSGRPFTLEDLRGHVSVADFIFTTCGSLCPRMTARMSRLRDELPAEVRFVSFTVDPAHDTPEVLRRYAGGLDAGDRWLFVTGGQAELLRLATDGFKLAALELPPGAAPDEGPFLHSSRFALVDPRGRVRGYYDSEDGKELEGLRRDARRLSEAEE